MAKKIFIFLTVFVTVFAMPVFAGCGTDGEEISAPPEFITGDEIIVDSDTSDETESDVIVDGAENDGDVDDAESEAGDETVEEEVADNSKNLIIPISELTSNAQFFGIIVDGTYMEVIAFKSGSTLRTAFNTCQICYGSRTAYYKQSGSYLVCQNCGSRFALSNVGLKASSYTCSPYPILETDRTVDGDNIIISYEFLVKTKNLFKTWKVT